MTSSADRPDMQGTLAITGDDDADELLNTDPFALLLGMLLDQQVPMEWAFRGPATLRERLGHLDPVRIAAMDPEDLDEAFRRKPALHRFPGSMATRTHQLCQHLVEHHGGDASDIWTGIDEGAEVRRRLQELPGYGKEKSQIFVALLVKRMGCTFEGWKEAAGPFADTEPRSVADVDGEESLAEVRQWKKAQKAKGRSKAD
ncbi:MAG: Fe-S cluster assembly protein HesB [Acidimicrobiia bacterium]|nr:Fe-S cluster assembly protein HesB [Acidimicrobiia bacterium]